MTINHEQLINWKIPEVAQQLTRRDTILYALGVGLGSDPCDANQLKYVYEPNLEALPSMATIPPSTGSGLWMVKPCSPCTTWLRVMPVSPCACHGPG